MSIMDLKKNAPKGEFLAYINKKEAAMLKKAGGSGKLVNGIPSFRPQDSGNAANQKSSAASTGSSSKNSTKSSTTSNTTSNTTSSNNNDARDAYRRDYVSQSKVKGGGKKKTGTVDTNNDGKDDRTGESTYEDIKVSPEVVQKQKDKVTDYTKAQTIYGYQPNKYLDYVPYLGTIRKTVGTPFTKTGKTLSAKKRMEYINLLPPQQRRAMIERLGLAEDEEYDELDEYNLATQTYTDPKTGKVTGPAGVFNTEDVDPNFGRYDNVGTDYTLTGDPLSYQGETPLYSMGAYDIINYDGEYLRQNKRDTTNKGSGRFSSDQTILPYPFPQEDDTDDTDDTDDGYQVSDKYQAADVTRGSYNFNQGGRVPAMNGGIMGTRARRAMGGIMSRVDQRQGYFLGKIVKGVKSAIGGVADAAGKVLKSDFGKMALLAAGAYYTGGALGGGGGFGNFSQLGKSAMSGLGRFKNLAGAGIDKYKNLGNFGKAVTMGIGGIGLALSPLGKVKPNEASFSKRGERMKDSKGNEALPYQLRAEIDDAYESGDPERIAAIEKYYAFLPPTAQELPYEEYGEAGYRTTVATGGRIGRAEGGLMDLGGMEKDYRAEGGFVPIGEYEKKDDVPARLSVNEFVFTADAVRGAGQGDIDKGAEIMENMMENLENGGTISEESQGKNGAQQMFETSQRLGEVV